MNFIAGIDDKLINAVVVLSEIHSFKLYKFFVELFVVTNDCLLINNCLFLRISFSVALSKQIVFNKSKTCSYDLCDLDLVINKLKKDENLVKSR